MNAFYNIMIGYFFGFALGVGCALAVMYTIYTNGYKRGIEHTLLREKPKGYYSALDAVQKRLNRQQPQSAMSSSSGVHTHTREAQPPDSSP
jgi:hypothetical protein